MISRRTSAITVSFIFLFVTSGCHAKIYNTTGGRVEGKKNVHLVAHSHDDAGWLRTVNQYYYGDEIYRSDWDKQMGGVQYVLDTAIAALYANPDRKFTYSDMAFFLKWWDEQSDASKKAVAQLVKNGQLDFVNGGYVQHDEAGTHYVAMIDQTTVGHQFLNRSFGFTPTVGWQIDPFGHSGTQASLMCGALGFDALYFARTDYQDRFKRASEKNLELLWRGAKSYGSSADVFTGSFSTGDYNAPPRFTWEWGFEDWKNSEPIVDCDDCGERNIIPRLDDFVNESNKKFNNTMGDDIMLTMGTDFTYANAFVWYKNMDKLIHYAKLDGRLNIFYSTPAAYTAAKHAYNQTWALKTDDFFPYADNEWSYWTGYFTSRPASKGYVRTCTSFLQAARQMEVLGTVARAARLVRQTVSAVSFAIRGPTVKPASAAAKPEPAAAAQSFAASQQQPGEAPSSTHRLEMAVALLQHHDAITGTARQDVADDYHMRLARGMAVAEEAFRADLASLALGEGADAALDPAGKWAGDEQTTNLQTAAEQPDHAGNRLGMCPFLNATVCHPTVEMSRLGHSIRVVIYNPLAWPRIEGVRVPLVTSLTSNWTVTDGSGKAMESQLVAVANRTVDLQNLMLEARILDNLTAAASHELVFRAAAPPLGYSTYTISPARAGQPGAAAASTISTWANGVRQENNLTEPRAAVEVSNGLISLTVSPKTGGILSLISRTANLATQLNTEVIYYNASDSRWPFATEKSSKPEASGAYIFRPNGVIASTGPIPIQIVEGPVLTEIRQEFYPWATLITRIWKGAEHIETEWTAGPIPFQDKLGRELVIRYKTNVTSGDEFYTDANGREMIKRKVNFRPTWNLDVKQPIAGNYYPLTAAIYIEEEAGRQLAVVTDRAQGGSSLNAGQVEIMVHRRLMNDDHRGVAEHLNETMCGCYECHCGGLVARGTHYITVQGPKTAASYRRTLQQRVNDPLVLAFGRAASPNATLAASQGPVSFLADEVGLPKSVHLLTLKDNGDGRVLLRLAHLYQIDEEAEEAKTVSVDLNKLFKDLKFDAAEEVTLAAGKPISQVKKLKWKAGESLSNDTTPVASYVTRTGLSCQNGCNAALNIELQPMEIRTFLLVPRPVTSASTRN